MTQATYLMTQLMYLLFFRWITFEINRQTYLSRLTDRQNYKVKALSFRCKALETDRKDDDVQWLTYWVVFAVFTFLEFFSDIVLSWMPFYFLLKVSACITGNCHVPHPFSCLQCAFLVWCMLPIASNGSMTIYRGIVRPYFLKYETDLDKVVDQAGKAASDISSKAKDVAGNGKFLPPRLSTLTVRL